MEKNILEFFSGFSKLNYEARLKKVKQWSKLSESDISLLKSGITSPDLAESFIENVLGYFDIPLGVAVNFIIDKKPKLLPLAVEETSIIAAASKTGKWIAQHGEIKTEVLGRSSIGQIQIPHVKDAAKLRQVIQKEFPNWKAQVNQGLLASMFKRGGGLKDHELRIIKHPKKGHMAVWHLHIQTCDAMGANLINQVCEYLKPLLEEKTKEEVYLCILSNLADKQLVRATITLRNQDPHLIQKIQEASLFAEVDPYRAATSNKGVLNGIDALMLATGNDWRAVEAGLHAYACRDGSYSSLTRWRVNDKGELCGVLEGPFMLGTVGGVTELHPAARLSLKILENPNREELARITCALGLAQNLAALRALVTEGVIEGHMRLHIKNLSLQAGATKEECLVLDERCRKILQKEKRISLRRIQAALQALREEKQLEGSF